MKRLVVGLAVLLVAACQQAPTPQASGCAGEVERLRQSSGAEIQGGGRRELNQRTQTKFYLDQAAAAAARGDETGCLRLLGQAQATVM
jgi:hypothetical protein